MCPRYILSDNGTEFKNQLMDQVQQLCIDCIVSTPYHPVSNGKLEVFHKYLKPTLKKLCKKDPANWDKYINQVLASYRATPNPASAETPFFLVYGRDPNLPLHQLLELMQWFLGDPESGLLNLEAHWLALAITKKILDENHFRTAQQTMGREPLSFKIGNRVYFKNKQPGKWDLKWRPAYRIVHIEHDRHHLHTENQATGKTRSCNVKDIVLEPPVEFWNIDTQFSRARKDISHPANLPTIMLNNWKWTPYSCKKSPVNNSHSPSLLYIMFGYTCWSNSPPGEPAVCIIPTSTESLPHPPFLDNHSSHIFRKSAETMENVC